MSTFAGFRLSVLLLVGSHVNALKCCSAHAVVPLAVIHDWTTLDAKTKSCMLIHLTLSFATTSFGHIF